MRIVNNIINFLITVMTLFVLTFVWSNYYLKNANTSFMIAVLITAILSLIIGIIFKNKEKLNLLTTEEKNILNKSSKNLLLSSNDETINFFIKIFEKDYVWKKEKNKIYLKGDKNIVFIPLFNKIQINENDIIFQLNNFADNGYEIIVACNEFSSSATVFFNQIENIKIEIYDIKKLYKTYFLPKQIFPDFKYKIKDTTKIRYKDLLKITLAKDNAKKYFWFGILLMFFSFFTLYNLYYIIFGSVLLILSFICNFSIIKLKE